MLAFKKEFSLTKATSSAFHITGGSVRDGVSEVSVAGGGASAKKASRRKDFIDAADKITAHKRQLDNPSVGDPDIMDVFQDLFQTSSKLMHGVVLGVKKREISSRREISIGRAPWRCSRCAILL